VVTAIKEVKILTEKILIRAPEEVKTYFVKTAKEMGISMNALILQMMWDFIKHRQVDE
jgi:predicted HicB family RNase H-like nuclease